MKLFQVTTERDGNTVKAQGVLATEIIKDTMFFAAESIEDVWDYIHIREDQERELIAIYEAAPYVTVISASDKNK